jgi:hypothetical protein
VAPEAEKPIPSQPDPAARATDQPRPSRAESDGPVPAFVQAKNGECGRFYVLVEGICAHVEYQPGMALVEHIERYKRGAAPPMVGGSEYATGFDLPTPTTAATVEVETASVAAESTDIGDLDPGALRGSSRSSTSTGKNTQWAQRSQRPDVSTRKTSLVNKASGVTDRERRQCDEAKARLARYKREGVLGINSATGKLGRMPKEEEAFLIQSKADEVEILCDGIY